MIIYQLVAWGQLSLTGEYKGVHSKEAYHTEEEALSHENEFKVEVSIPKDKADNGYLERKSVRVFIDKLELADK